MAEPRLSPLREELALHAGPRGGDGAPTWTLQDPTRNRFFRIGWVELEMLSRWHLGSPSAIAAAVRAETTIDATAAQVEAFALFLARQGLVRSTGVAAVDRLVRQAEAARPHWLAWLVKSYLFFRVPVVRPDRFLAWAMPVASPFFHPLFAVLTVAAAVVGGYLVVRQWDGFLGTFLHFFSLEGMVLAGAALTGAKVVHELGHAFTARRYGCRVPSMGVAFLVMWPVLYTDTTEVWTLPSRRQRLAVGAAGMTAEVALAAYATLAWSFLPDGPLRSAAFLLAGSTWLLTLMVNLNPLMRFDGYYLLSDALDIPNLQDRAFALARWRLRELAFGFGDPPPERLPGARRRTMLVYAYATWIYRFFLFLGIALLVYHLFFKALGVVLFAIEIGWFILRPLAAEAVEWSRRRRDMSMNRNTLATLSLLLVGAGLAVYPWQGSVSAPAVLRAEQQSGLFVPASARLEAIHASPGRAVAEGDLLFRFAAPDTAFELAQAQRRAAVLQWRAQNRGLLPEGAEAGPSLWRELEEAAAAVDGLQAELARLDVLAPMDGVVVDLADPLAVGEWLAEGGRLATVVAPGAGLVEAYLAEADLWRVRVGTRGRFLPDDPGSPWVAVRVVSIAEASSRVLPEAALASVHGGAVAARQGRDGTLYPENPVYRVRLRPEQGTPAPSRVLRGSVVLDGERESAVARLWRIAVGVLVRESGF